MNLIRTLACGLGPLQGRVCRSSRPSDHHLVRHLAGGYGAQRSGRPGPCTPGFARFWSGFPGRIPLLPGSP